MLLSLNSLYFDSQCLTNSYYEESVFAVLEKITIYFGSNNFCLINEIKY